MARKKIQIDSQIEPLISGLEDKAAGLPDAERDSYSSDLRRLRELVQNQERRLLECRRTVGETEQRLERERMSSIENASEILESISDAFYAVDAAWRLTYVNQQAESWWSIPREKLIGKKLWEVFPSLQQLESYRPIERAMRKRVPVHFETYSQMIKTWVEVNVYPAKDGGVAIYFRDISDRKRMEEKDAFQSMLLARVRDAVIATDAKIRVTYFNQAAEEMFGWTAAEALGQPTAQLLQAKVPGESREQALNRLFETGHFEGEVSYRRKDGTYFDADVRSAILCGPQGETNGLLTTIRDITRNKQVEKALKESEQLYRAIGETIDYGVWVCAPDGRNLYASPSFLNLVGITQQECSDFGWGDTLHPDDAERTITAWKECVRSEGVWDIEHRFMGRDGQYHPILARGVPVRDEQGRIAFWAGINLDISRIKQAEQALRESEEHFRVALKHSPIMVYTTDRQLRYNWVYNPALGFSESQLIGKMDEEINNPESVAELVALKRSVLESGIGRRQEIQINYLGEVYSYDVTVEPIQDDSGEIAGLTVAEIDITDKKRLEQTRLKDQLQIELQRRLMEQRENERQSIARDIHDGPVQTLSSTLFNLQFTKEAFSDPLLAPELDQIALNIREATQELRQIIYELRPPSVIRFGLARAIRFHAEDIVEKNPDLKLSLHIEDIECALSEQACLTLYRIYQEAINNASRHSGGNRAWVRLTTRGDELTLQIRDNGKGLPADYDIDRYTLSSHYGLAGIKERVEVLGGKLKITTEPGKGTNIQVKVPVSKY